MINEAWLRETVKAHEPWPDLDESVPQLRTLLEERAHGFASMRDDILSATIVWPRRGLLPDESASFLRAVANGIAEVDHAGFVTMPTVKPKMPPGRYALFSKSGSGVSLNLEYLIQVGATAELILDHGWVPHHVEFERGPFDALASALHD